MKTTLLGLIAAGVLLVSGCGTSRKTAASVEKPPPVLEHRAVEFMQKSESDIREHLAQWQQEGWNVMSLSKPLPQADGTVLRRAELTRSKP